MTNPYTSTSAAFSTVQGKISPEEHHYLFHTLFPFRNAQDILVSTLIKHLCDELRSTTLSPRQPNLDACLPIILRLTDARTQRATDQRDVGRGAKAVVKGPPRGKNLPDDSHGEGSAGVR